MLHFSIKIITYLLVFQVFTVSAQHGWKPLKNRMATQWAAEVSPENVWPEYPRPTMQRERWLNLNGEWGFQLMNQNTESVEASGKILVPFPVESTLSGIGKKVKPEHLMIYNRSFTLPKDWAGQRILLHFGAVDYAAEVFLNNKKVGGHTGGFDPFTLDLTDFLKPGGGPQQLSVQITDPTNFGGQPTGKQHLDPSGMWCTPNSGIWQTVWLEPVPRTYIKSIRVEPDVDKTRALVRVELAGDQPKRTQVIARILDGGNKLSESKGMGATPHLLRIRKGAKLWTLDHPHLYDLEITTVGKEADVVKGYFGLRKISVGKDENGVPRLLLNNESVFQNGLLDQGLWPESGYTAPSEAAMKNELETIKKMGFNMLRKHVKVEPARWYYLCDKMGLLVWQEMPYGTNETERAQKQFRFELKAMTDALFNHPSIVTWTLFVEGRGQHETDSYVKKLKEWDPTRLVVGASGGTDSGSGDIRDIHSYPKPAAPEMESERAMVLGQFGGLSLNIRGHTWNEKGRGFANVDTPDELLSAYEDFRRELFFLQAEKGLSAAVYTQLADGEREINGLFTADRALTKIDPTILLLTNAGYLPPKPVGMARIFPKKRLVKLATPQAGAEIWYTFDELSPTAEWKKYTEPFFLKKTTKVTTRAQWPDGKESRSREYFFEKTKALKSKAPKNLPSGLSLKIYKGEWDKLPDFSALSPNKTLTVNELNLDTVKMEKHFGLVAEAWIEVPETDAYLFGVTSNDGSRLMVAGRTVVENDGVHGKREAVGSVALKKGRHPVRLEYFPKNGAKELDWWMMGPDGKKRKLRF